jgi:hypothetical protein
MPIRNWFLQSLLPAASSLSSRKQKPPHLVEINANRRQVPARFLRSQSEAFLAENGYRVSLLEKSTLM